MTPRTRVVLLSALLAGCSRTASPAAGLEAGAPAALEAGPETAAPATAAAGPPDRCKAHRPCEILQAADVDQAFGTAYAQGSASEVAGEVHAQCVYSGSEPEVRLETICAAHDLTPSGRATMKQVFLGSGHTCSPVAGVGDDALWCTPTPGGGKEMFGDQLVFFVGPFQATLQLRSQKSGPHNSMVPASDPRAGAEKLARVLASRL